MQEYRDEEVWHREREVLFKRLPLLLGFTCEVSKPGDYKAVDAMGVPVLISRGKDGQLRAFINICRHRAANIVRNMVYSFT